MARKLKTINRTGLVGEWLLNGNALDTSGNGNNGTATNVTYTSTDRAYQSQCGVFTASASNINISSNTLFPNSSPSVFLWIRPSATSLTNGHYAFIAMSGSYQLIYIRVTNGKLNFITGTGVGFSDTGNDQYGIPVSNFTANTWYLIGLTQSGTTIRQYINGVEFSSYTSTGNFAPFTGTPSIYISRNNTEQWSGDIQGVRIFNRAISQQEIQTLYQEGLRQLGGEGYGTLFDGLVSYYDFNGDAQDIVGGNNGTVTGATLTTDRFGTTNHAYSFDGVNNYITMPAPDYYGTQALTLLISFKLNAIPSNNNGTVLLTFTESAIDSGFFDKCIVVENTGNVYFKVFDGGDKRAYFTSPLTTGIWYNILGVYNGTNITIYVNGVQGNTTTVSGTYNFTTPIMAISSNPGGNGERFNGIVDYTNLFNRALSAGEVKALYELSSKRYLYPF